MWRSIFGARRYALTLRTRSPSAAATSPPQVRHAITSYINHSSLFFSTNPNEPDTDSSTFSQAGDIVDDLAQNPLSVFPVDNIIEENNDLVVVNCVDIKKLEGVLSLLQSNTNPKNDDKSLAAALDEMGIVYVDEDFVIKVLDTPLVPGEKLISFFKWVLKKTESFSPTSRCFEALVRVISGQRNAYDVWDLIKEVGKGGKNEENCVLNTSILNGLISELSKFGKAKAVKEVFDKFDCFGCVPDSDTYYVTIDALCRREFYNWACLVVEKMIGSGNLPEGERVGKIISYLCKGEKTKEAHSVYLLAKEKNEGPPRSSVNFLISSLSLGNEKMVRLGLEMLSDFSGEERKFAVKSFSSVVRGLCRIKDVGLAKDLLAKMTEEGPPPGNAVFNSIISGLSKAGEMGEAKNMVKMMESRGLRPDVFTYTVIMSGYTKGGEMEEACKVLSEMKEKHSKLSHVTYHTLIRGYCKLGEFENAVKLLGEMREFGVEPNVDEYNKLIQTLCLKAFDFETAEKLLAEMEEKGLHLSGSTKALLRASKEVAEEEEGAIVGGGEKTVAL